MRGDSKSLLTHIQGEAQSLDTVVHRSITGPHTVYREQQPLTLTLRGPSQWTLFVKLLGNII